MILIELRYQMLERIPRCRVGPLHIVQYEHERTGRRRQADVLDDFLVQRVLATDAFRSRLGAVGQRGDESRQLAPDASWSIHALLDRRENFRPRSIRRLHVGLERATHDE